MQLSSQGLSAVIGINRAQNVVDTMGRGVSIVLPINDWIMPDNNKLSVLFSRPEGNTSSSPSVDIHIFVADPRSRRNDPLRTLLQFSWPLPPPAPSIIPYLADLPFNVTDPPPCMLWNDAETITNFSNNDKIEIIRIVEHFRQALETRNAADAYAFMEYRYRDSAIADGSNYNTLASGIRELYQEMLATTDLRSEPLTPTNAVFDIVCEGKVVLVSRGLGKDAVRFEAGQVGQRRAFGFKIFVAFIKRRWMIVR